MLGTDELYRKAAKLRCTQDEKIDVSHMNDVLDRMIGLGLNVDSWSSDLSL